MVGFLDIYLAVGLHHNINKIILMINCKIYEGHPVNKVTHAAILPIYELDESTYTLHTYIAMTNLHG